jgi:hypothetical protein
VFTKEVELNGRPAFEITINIGVARIELVAVRENDIDWIRRASATTSTSESAVTSMSASASESAATLTSTRATA